MRGEINNRERARQIRDYRELRWGTVTPTDEDGFLDFNNELFIHFELKLIGNDLTFGQRLAFERENDATEKSGIPTYYLIAEHNTPIDKDINCAEALVIECRYKGKWKIIENPIILLDAINEIRKKHGFTNGRIV